MSDTQKVLPYLGQIWKLSIEMVDDFSPQKGVLVLVKYIFQGFASRIHPPGVVWVVPKPHLRIRFVIFDCQVLVRLCTELGGQ